jgi:hypothetical protein
LHLGTLRQRTGGSRDGAGTEHRVARHEGRTLAVVEAACRAPRALVVAWALVVDGDVAVGDAIVHHRHIALIELIVVLHIGPVIGAEIARRDGVGRVIGFARPERRPTDGARGEGGGGQGAGGRTQEGHQSRGIDRLIGRVVIAGVGWCGNPAPAAAELSPPPVMEGGKSPRRVIHPGPAPGLHIGPMAVAIGHPGTCHLREPDGADIGLR